MYSLTPLNHFNVKCITDVQTRKHTHTNTHTQSTHTRAHRTMVEIQASSWPLHSLIPDTLSYKSRWLTLCCAHKLCSLFIFMQPVPVNFKILNARTLDRAIFNLHTSLCLLSFRWPEGSISPPPFKHGPTMPYFILARGALEPAPIPTRAV